MNNMKLLRQSRHERQWQIAEALGTTERGYRKIENGENLPSYKNIKALEKHFKKAIDYLLEQVDDGGLEKARNKKSDTLMLS